MKHLNRKITLMSFALLLATGQGIANTSALLSSNDSAGNNSAFNKVVDSERGGARKLFVSPTSIYPPVFVTQCLLTDPRNGKKNINGVLCKDGTCVKSANLCPKTPSSSYKETALDKEI